MRTNLSQWLDYIEQLHPRLIDLGLERIKHVAKILNLTPSVPVISIAGTNGKGSCVAFLESILTKAGYRVAAYTSPHLLRFNERIRIQGMQAHDDELCRAFNEIERARGEISLTYFEFSTLAALLLFKQAKLDAWILEVGMGGRLDAVNMIDADIAAITTIDMDHMDWLGNNREQIGYEKAGILRPHTSAVCGDINPPHSILDYSAQIQANLRMLNHDYSYQEKGETWSWKSKTCHYSNLVLPCLPLQNAATALMVLECLQATFTITEQHINQGLQDANLQGRFQRFTHPAHIIMDVAHNPASSQFLAAKLRNDPPFGQTRVVASVLADKDINGTLTPLVDLADAWYVSGLPVARGATGENLVKSLQLLGAKKCYNYSSIAKALRQAIYHSKTQDRIVVFGSFYTVAEALKIIGEY